MYIISLCVSVWHHRVYLVRPDETQNNNWQAGKGLLSEEKGEEFWFQRPLCCLSPHSSVSSKTLCGRQMGCGDEICDGVCLNPSYREPLQGRWRADNPTAWVGRLQNYRQTSAVGSCCGAPSTGQHGCEIWQCWLSVSTKYILDCLDIRRSHSLVASPFQDWEYCILIVMVICGGVCWND